MQFSSVSTEIGSLVSRRRELNTFLGSLFAALGIFLQNTLQGSLPERLARLEEHIFLFYAVLLMVPSLLLSLRMARLHGGMVIQGMLYARWLSDQDFTWKGDVERASAHNFFSVSFLQSLLADFIAAFSAAVVALSLAFPVWVASVAGIVIFVTWLAIYFRFHRRAVLLARSMIASESFGPLNRKDWENHVSESLKDANLDLISSIGFVGLIIFSIFEVMSGLGHIKTSRPPDIQFELIRLYGPQIYTLMMLVTCFMGLLIYLRLRVVVGKLSLDLEPIDRPFRPLVLTDSLLGYLLMAFFLTVSIHLSLIQFVPFLPIKTVFIIDGAMLAISILAEQIALVVADRRYRQRPIRTSR